MKNPKLLYILFFFAAVTCKADLFTSSKATDDRAETVGAFFGRSGIATTIDTLGLLIEAQLKDGAQPSALQKAQLQTNAITFLLENYNKGMFELGNQWLNTDNYVQFLRILNSDMTGSEDFIKDFWTSPITAQRRELLLRLDRALQYTETGLELAIIQSVAVGVFNDRANPSIVEDMARTLVKANRDQLHRDAQARLAFMVSNLADAELDALVSNIETPVPQFVMGAIRGAIINSVARSIPLLYREVRGL